MHIRKLRNILLLLTLWLVSRSILAQAPAVTRAPEAPQTLEQAAAQRARASQMHGAAEKRYAIEQEACYQKLLVNRCLDDAKKHYTQSVIDARNVDIPARDFQREAKRADVEAKEAQRAADRSPREIEQKAQAESYRADEAAKAVEREKKIAAKAQKAVEGRKKAADEQALRLEKQEKRAQKENERAGKKAGDVAKKPAIPIP